MQGLGDVDGRTSATAQQVAKQPPPGEFLHTAKQMPVPEPRRDPCNHPEVYKPSGAAPNLWPPLQIKGAFLSSSKPVSA